MGFLVSPAGFHSDLHSLYSGVVSLRCGVHVVGLGLPCAQPDQHLYPPLRQVSQFLQPPHLLRPQLKISQRRGRAAAVHQGRQRHGQAQTLQDEGRRPRTSGLGGPSPTESSPEPDREEVLTCDGASASARSRSSTPDTATCQATSLPHRSGPSLGRRLRVRMRATLTTPRKSRSCQQHDWLLSNEFLFSFSQCLKLH